MRSKILLAIILIIYFIFPLPALSEENEDLSLNQYLRFFYNKHSHFLDQTYHPFLKSWHFDIPYYMPSYRWQSSRVHPRYHMSSAYFYKYRLTDSPYLRSVIREAVLNSSLNNKKLIFDQSFEDAIANFLIIRIIEQDDQQPFEKRVINPNDKEKILNWINERLIFGLKAIDSENRAAIAGVYWLYCAQYLFENNFLTQIEFEYIKEDLKVKVDLSITQTLNQGDYLYREQGRFSVHYHIVEAYMLLVWGHLTNDQSYIAIAREMTYLINQLAEADGYLDARLGYRPSGTGAQTYLMLGMLNLYFNQLDEAQLFLSYAESSRFFNDPKYPNRLVWYASDVDPDIMPESEIFFNDDISFVNMAELALVLFEGDKILPGL